MPFSSTLRHTRRLNCRRPFVDVAEIAPADTDFDGIDWAEVAPIDIVLDPCAIEGPRGPPCCVRNGACITANKLKKLPWPLEISLFYRNVQIV
jgi:hypothetical protein